MGNNPRILHTVIDGEDIRALAEFYRQFLGLVYRPGDEPPTEGADDADWLVLTYPDGTRCLAFQQVETLPPTNWPDPPGVPMQMHLDIMVDPGDLEAQRDRALALGATLRFDRSNDPEEPLYVLADPAGHPFCVFA